MILRDITIKDAVRNDEGVKRTKQQTLNNNGTSGINKRTLESQSQEPLQKNEPSFNILPMSIGINRECKYFILS
jgi:hypothetical protein